MIIKFLAFAFPTVSVSKVWELQMLAIYGKIRAERVYYRTIQHMERKKNMNVFMKKSNELAYKGMMKKEGGPFGAVIVDAEGKIVAIGNNQVLKTNDPTAHAEVVTIRKACKKLKTSDLSGYTLYTSCEPCPMCLSAIIWSNIKTVYYGCTRKDAGRIGFRDDKIYEYLKGNHKNLIHVKQLDREECLETMKKYKTIGGKLY